MLRTAIAIAVPAEISAAAVLVQFWNTSIHPAVWITIFLVFIVVVNFCGVRLYGEVRSKRKISRIVADMCDRPRYSLLLSRSC